MVRRISNGAAGTKPSPKRRGFSPTPTRNTNSSPSRNDWTSDLYGGWNPSVMYSMRLEWLQAMIDPRRDMDKECGYPYVILPKQYRQMFDREGVATRVVSIYPDECWAMEPQIYEHEEADEKAKTPLMEAWEAMRLNPQNDPISIMHTADIQSRVGRYGLLLLGTDDGLDLSEPLPHLDEFGFPVQGMAEKQPLRLLYMRVFDESMAHIINYERDPSNPRFGQPVFYHVIFADVRVGEPGMTAAAITVTSRVVHWSRVLHFFDNRESSNVFGVPSMQPVFNRLCDVRKILGGSAEMFWKGGFPGYSFELNPDLVTAGVTLDDEALKHQFESYSNGLQRYLAVIGLQAKSLAPQVANPEGNLQAQLQAIALAIGVPLRIFTGSEQAQLASGQDVRTWNRRLSRRQNRYLTPYVVRPFVDRCCHLGILPYPETGSYQVRWPDVNMPSAQESSQVADRISAAIMKYVMSGGNQVIPVREFLTFVLNLPTEQVTAIMTALKKKPEVEIIPPATKTQDGLAKGEQEHLSDR